jgi:hypothetical protein
MRAPTVALSIAVAAGAFGLGDDAAAKPPPKSAAANLPIALEIEPAEATRWTMRLRNTGTAAVQVPADARLLELQVFPSMENARGRRTAKAARCALPADLRPEADQVGTLSLDSGKAVALDFDPRLICFGVTEATALANAGAVTASISLIGVAPLSRGRAPTVTSDRIELKPEARPQIRPNIGGTTNADPGVEEVVVSMPARIDGTRASVTSMHVDVQSLAPTTRTAFIRPGNVGFLVEGPTGAFACPVKGTPPIRELETTLRSKGKGAIDVLLAATCAGRSFDRPGLYVVRPIFSTKKPPWDQGRSLAGEWVGAPSLVRLRAGSRPFLAAPPRLE